MKCINISPIVVNEYLTTNITLIGLASKLNIDPRTLSKKLKNHGVMVRPVLPPVLKYECKTDFFKLIDSEVKAYWLGFIYAEGWLSCEFDKRRNTSRLRFGMELSALDKEHLAAFKKSIASTAKISIRTRKSKTKYIKLACIRVGDKDFCESLLAYFKAGKKSAKIQLPNIPVNLMHHFIRGYFDGDGCIMKDGCISFTSNSIKMLNGLEDVFSSKVPGYERLHHMYKYRRCFKLIKSRLKALPIYEYMYNNATTVLPRKYKRYCQIFGLA